MKLIIRQYLASLKERDELDVLIPELLSQMGLNVYSRPGRGTSQEGVDVAAVGSIDGGPEKIYLFTIKPGDYGRQDWADTSPQSVVASLRDIVHSYLPDRVPTEHREKPVVICFALGGEVKEVASRRLNGFIRNEVKGDNLTAEIWNGEKLADLILRHFLREDLLPADMRGEFRKALAMVDEPDIAYRHFRRLASSLVNSGKSSPKANLRSVRLLALTTGVLFGWSRDSGNLEAAYRSSELALLSAWHMIREALDRKVANAAAMTNAFESIVLIHLQISRQWLDKDIFPHAGKKHALSIATNSRSTVDINLKLFDVVGRVAMSGLWALWQAERSDDQQLQDRAVAWAQLHGRAVVSIINENPALHLPLKDDQAIDIFLAMYLEYSLCNGPGNIVNWASTITQMASHALRAGSLYPCIFDDYDELIRHPEDGDEYLKRATAGSILYPTLGAWAAVCGARDLLATIGELQSSVLTHSNFQYWYPDDATEAHLYLGDEHHGAVMSHIDCRASGDAFLARLDDECAASSEYWKLSAVRHSWWPIVLVACRHHRIPPPLHLITTAEA